jgi:hypothetical protein
VYAVIRSNEEEAILVLVNLTGAPISDYELSLQEGILPDGQLTPVSLLGADQASPLAVSGGTFSGYKPLAELEAYQAYIFQLR